MATAIPVVIPTWNGRHLLEGCLEALSASTHPVHAVVVDNGSEDGTADWLAAAHPHAQIIRNARNLGFAAAVNQGVRASDGSWVALLNNDAIPFQDWLAQLLAEGERDPRTGAVASRMMSQSAPGLVASAGIRADPAGGAFDLLMGENRWPEAPVEVFGASGGACLLRRAMLDDIGLFDEGFFAYLEDVDLAWRARLRGWRAMLAPRAVVHHALSATGREGSPFKRFHLARNKWRVILRTYPMPQLLTNLPLILFYDALGLGHALVRGDAVPLRGRLAALRQLPLLLRQRRAIQRRRTVSWGELAHTLSPLESPLALYRRTRLVAKVV